MLITLRKQNNETYNVEGVVIPSTIKQFVCPSENDIIKTFKIAYQSVLNTDNYEYEVR